MAEKMLTAAASLSADQQPAPRYHGKAIIVLLRKENGFDKALSGLPINVRKKITDVVEAVDSKVCAKVSNVLVCIFGHSFCFTLGCSVGSGVLVRIQYTIYSHRLC